MERAQMSSIVFEGPSSLLPEGFEVQFEHLIYNAFETDLWPDDFRADPSQAAHHGGLRLRRL